jgi:hypothetical protein
VHDYSLSSGDSYVEVTHNPFSSLSLNLLSQRHKDLTPSPPTATQCHSRRESYASVSSTSSYAGDQGLTPPHIVPSQQSLVDLATLNARPSAQLPCSQLDSSYMDPLLGGRRLFTLHQHTAVLRTSQCLSRGPKLHRAALATTTPTT